MRERRRAIASMLIRRPRHGSSSSLMSLRHPCLAPIRESSLSLSLLRSDSTTLDEPPYRVHPPIFVGPVARNVRTAGCAPHGRTPSELKRERIPGNVPVGLDRPNGGFQQARDQNRIKVESVAHTRPTESPCCKRYARTLPVAVPSRCCC